MANQEDIDRAEAGKDIWNAWAENELNKPEDERAKVDFTGAPIPGINFSGFVFPGDVSFKGATFEGVTNFEYANFEDRADFEGAMLKDLADFEGAIFKGEANFRGATFEDLANFEGATFEVEAVFKGATFESGAHFEGATFEAFAIFNNATFKDRTIFTGATFQIAPLFHNADIHHDTSFSFGEDFFRQFPDIKSNEAERAYRTLKLAMNKYQAHMEEVGFLKLELKAQAYKEKWYRKWPYGAYGLFSDYGQGILRPVIWWAGLGLAMFALYFSILGNPGEAVIVTIAQAMPLIGIEKEAMEALFPPDGNAPLWFQITRAAHMLASSALIFLALLALRNRFKIK
jgi:hypothetical protein